VNRKSTLTALIALLSLLISCAGPSCAACCDLKAPRSETGQSIRSNAGGAAMPADCAGMQMDQTERSQHGPTLSSRDCCGYISCGHNVRAAVISPIQEFKQPPVVLTSVLTFGTIPSQIKSHLEFTAHSPPLEVPGRNSMLRI